MIEVNNEADRMISVIEAGFVYDLHNLGEGVQQVKFIKKAPKEEGSTELVTVQEGTTNEAVIEMFIHRLKVLNGLLPDDFTLQAIEYAEKAQQCLFERTASRKERGVEGTHQA